jgi:hypothetical protein
MPAKGGHRHLQPDDGLCLDEEGIDFVTETELFATSPTGRRAAARSRSAMSMR